MPEEKLSAIHQLRKQENKIAMVGHSVNDASAMAISTVGIAMGAAGSDVALEKVKYMRTSAISVMTTAEKHLFSGNFMWKDLLINSGLIVFHQIK